MGMTVGSKAGPKSEINLTPMIDVLLVLIIIFMVIMPTKPVGLEALIPQQSDSAVPPQNDIVITVLADGTYRLNQESLDLLALQKRLAALFRPGTNQVVFIRGDKNLEFAPVAELIDLAHSYGVAHIGLMTN
jgi:biopolymer transport protein TolR